MVTGFQGQGDGDDPELPLGHTNELGGSNFAVNQNLSVQRTGTAIVLGNEVDLEGNAGISSVGGNVSGGQIAAAVGVLLGGDLLGNGQQAQLDVSGSAVADAVGIGVQHIAQVVGLPGCVMYAKRTVFDLVLCRLLAKDVVTYEELCDLGEGGLCLGCDICTYPNCGFGK